MRRLLTGAAVALLAALVLLFAVGLRDRNAGRDFVRAVQDGKKPAAPHFDLAELDGPGRLTVADLAGRPAVVNFWASWCVPCREEAGVLNAAAGRWQGRARFVGIDSDDLGEDARAFARRYRVAYPLVKDSGSVKDRWGVTGFPETFVLDAQGRAVAHFGGPVDDEDVENALEQARRMRRGIAVAFALLALGAAALAWAIVGASEAGAPERGWTVAQMERELMCPVCDSRLDMSTQPAANRIRVFLAAKRQRGLDAQPGARGAARGLRRARLRRAAAPRLRAAGLARARARAGRAAARWRPCWRAAGRTRAASRSGEWPPPSRSTMPSATASSASWTPTCRPSSERRRPRAGVRGRRGLVR